MTVSAPTAQGTSATPTSPVSNPCEANADTLDGYAHGWDEATRESYAHDVAIKRDGGHGYPYRAVCPCGWQSRTYAAPHAAGSMGDAHITEQAMRNVSAPAHWGR